MRKMVFIVVMFLCLLCTTWVLAQQEVNYNMYRYHLNLINPAVTGTQGAAYANFSLRTQWVGIADAPETQAFSAGTPNKRQRLGTGFSVINDKTFVENQTQLFADFSYRLPLDNERDLYLGLKAGGTSIRLHADRLKTYGSVLPDQFLTSQSSCITRVRPILCRCRFRDCSVRSGFVLTTVRCRGPRTVPISLGRWAAAGP